MRSLQKAGFKPLALALALLGLMTSGIVRTAFAQEAAPWRVIGELDDQMKVTGRSATLVFGEEAAEGYRASMQVTLAPAGAARILVQAEDPTNYTQGAARMIAVSRQVDQAALHFYSHTYNPHEEKWERAAPVVFNFWPTNPRQAGLVPEGIEPGTWVEQPLRLRIEAHAGVARVWLADMLVDEVKLDDQTIPTVALELAQSDQLSEVEVQPFEEDWQYLTVDLTAHAQAMPGAAMDRMLTQSQDVPFLAATPTRLSLRDAQWIEWAQDPASYYEWYDAGQPYLHDPRMPMLRIPKADYIAAHVLAVADDDPERTNRLTIRAGRYGYAAQVLRNDFWAEVPRPGQDAEADAVQAPDGSTLYHVRVPMDAAFAQDIAADYLEMELTKEVRLARRKPDPARFRWRPLGLPSGVEIAAITFERSPLQMTVGSGEAGHVFVEPQQPTFKVQLANITPDVQGYTLHLTATHHDGGTSEAESAGEVQPGQTAEVEIPIEAVRRGYHDLVVTLNDGQDRTLLKRYTSFALLPPDTRQHRETSPFGVWDFSGGHFTPSDIEINGPLYHKAGLRYGMFGFEPEERQKYGVLPGLNPRAEGGLDHYLKTREQHPDLLPWALMFHEDGISGRHVSRVPDLFHDREPYKLDEKEQERFDMLWEQATKAAQEFRKELPEVKISFGNGTLPFKEAFYRRKFPAELFDAGGNESGGFGRPPEAQPPDPVAINSGVWMDRQLLDAYGYEDKPIYLCYEVIYPASNPGNLTMTTQADYFVRHCLHMLAWEFPHIRPGSITDMGNSYRYSNWGAIGLCKYMPEVNVKPAYVAMANMTQVLDGVKYVGDIDMGSLSLFGLAFSRPDGKNVFALWTPRGERDVTLQTEGEPAWQVIDEQGIEQQAQAQDGRLQVTLSPSVVYLVGKGQITGAQPSEARYEDLTLQGQTTVLDGLASLDDWEVQQGHDQELEYYNMLLPRRKGDFRFEPVEEFEGKPGVLKVTPQPIEHGKATMPMYEVLVHKEGVAIPGQPTDIGVWVNGNSSWGRLIFEFRDAGGQRWISIGAQQTGFPSPWLGDWLPENMIDEIETMGTNDWNTNDVYGVSRIDFDGWRFLHFPLPGNYPGEGYHWPANSQWRWDGDGVVKYPLTFTRLIVELPEKTLHVKRYEPPARPEIYLKDLSVVEREVNYVKQTPYDY